MLTRKPLIMFAIQNFFFFKINQAIIWIYNIANMNKNYFFIFFFIDYVGKGLGNGNRILILVGNWNCKILL